MNETREEKGTRSPRREEVKEMEEQQSVVSRRNEGRKNSRERRGEGANGVIKLRFGLGIWNNTIINYEILDCFIK